MSERHYDIVPNLGGAIPLMSALSARPAEWNNTLAEHLCLFHVTEVLGLGEQFQLAGVVAVDRCYRDCSRCGPTDSRVVPIAAGQRATWSTG